MRKIFITLLLSIASMLAMNTASAQAWNGKGDSKLQIGLSAYGHGTGLLATYDHGIANYLSLGLGGEFYFSNYKHNDANIFLFGRLNLHLNPLLNLPPELDIYPGLKLGFYNGSLGWGAHLGIRYFFTPKVGIFGEFGNIGGLGVVINL